MDDKEFLQAAERQGFLTPVQIEDCLKTQEEVSRAGVKLAIWELCLRKGFLKPEQVSKVRGGEVGFVFGPFTILSKIGEGGNGTVYLARKEGESRRVALKVLPQRLSSDSTKVARFEREARISIELSHPNLVKGYDFGRLHDRLYYAMEYVRGRVVAAHVRERGRLGEKAALQIALQIARALGEIHRRGLCHRDVKPENIIIGEDGVARLMDLGLIKSVANDILQLTQDGVAVGTLHYMSPEQAQGKEVDIRSDIYSLGASLYFMLTGVKPFKGTAPLEVMQSQLANELAPIASLRPDLPESTRRVIETMMGRAPEARYQTPAELQEDLSRVLEGEAPERAMNALPTAPPAAAREQAPLRPWWTVPKNALVLGGAAAAALFLIVWIVMGLAGGSAPPPPPPPPPRVRAGEPPRPGDQAEKSIRGLLESGALREAADLLDRDAPILGLDRAERLRGELLSAAERAWASTAESVGDSIRRGDSRGARRSLDRFQESAGGMPEFARRLEAERTRVAEAERERAQEAETRESFRVLEDSIRELEERGRYESALAFMEAARPSVGGNPRLAVLVDKKIESLRKRIGGAAPETAPSAGGNPSAAREEAAPVPAGDPTAPPPPAPADQELEPVWARAKWLYDSGELDGAIRATGELLKLAPQDARALALRSRCFIDRGNLVNARQDAHAALKADSNQSLAHLVLALAALREGGRAEAIAELTRAIAGDPGSHEAYFLRADSFAAQSEWKLALQDLEEAERYDPRGAQRKLEYVQRRLQIRERMGDLEGAVRECEEWIKLAPDPTPTPLLRRADLCMRLEWFDEGKDDYEAALKLDPKNGEAQRGRSAALKAGRSAKRPAAQSSDQRREMRRALEAFFNAASTQVQIASDGRAYVNLVYDFSKPRQIQDFAAVGAAPAGGAVDLDGSTDRAAAMVFKPLVFGEFFARAEFQFMTETDSKKQFGVRTAASAEPESAGEGVGMTVGRAARAQISGTPYPVYAAWYAYLYRYVQNPDYLNGYIPANVPAKMPLTLSLQRSGTKWTGIYANSVRREADEPGYSAIHLRFHANDKIRLTRIEIQGFLEEDWVRKTLALKNEGGRERLWNGRNAADWTCEGATLTVGEGQMVVEANASNAYLTHKEKQSGRSLRLSVELDLDEAHDGAMIGLGLLAQGERMETDGNVMARFGKVYSTGPGVRIDRRQKASWDPLAMKSDSLPLERGRFQIELVLAGGDLTLRVNDKLELRAPAAVPAGSVFKPVLVIQNARVRIRNVTLK
ncbi:MAG TPA: protein kinase [Planctomycetota bacterium]|nr:protein kinase [Planctomycetota bacterium]